jgi:hypothetical protein
MKAPAWLLPLFLTGTMGAVFFLPSAGEVAEAAVTMEMPEQSGQWFFRTIPPSEAELKALAADTEFAKAVCHRIRPGEFTDDGRYLADRLDLSIVLSGYDLNNSIHRPERCMPAQGHTILSSSDVELTLPDGHQFTVKRLLSVQTIPINEAHTEHLTFNCVTYYFFVGHDRITHDHLGRTFIDMKDRLIRGLDQRWAYASASMWFGKLGENLEITEKEADEKLRDFLIDLAGKQIKWDQIRS